ncbi:GNAT family N-acetyltransferase [Streptomyces iconiensis]|uniref:GNAT family N-acetyltransferase n=1 Tax=Streptomyces iconiensis TaxID=1384038 RepID=A0ABT6ZS24_9ACTN|nr:GNAT family N-acetyltransferase [Streptomyces iconiensis]MDJ1131441.1 GNAT family N-acetyltransferase [Streptomyces iconiensis]
MIPIGAETLHTDRLTLLPLLVEHASAMAEVLDDPDLHTFTGGTPASPEALRTRYVRLVAGSPHPSVRWCNWVIRLRASAQLTGTVQATVTETFEGYEAEVAWVVGTPWQARGIATEAARALVTWLEHAPIHRVVAHIHPRHHASAAVATAAGLTPTQRHHDGETRWERTLNPRRTD